jgi:alpha-aminoadipic semialdehyde synthase
LIESSRNGKGDEIDQTLERAKIVTEGVITAEHSWLAPRVEGWRNTQAGSSRQVAPTPMADIGGGITSTSLLKEKKKKVLLLGSGLVAGPAVDVFVARGDVDLVIGTSCLPRLLSLIFSK